MMRILLSVICTGVFFTFSYSQNPSWRTLITEPDANFYDIQRSFYEEFGEEPGGKGSGWKQFKRWEYYHQDRIDDEGNLQPAGHVLREMQQYYGGATGAGRYAVGSGNWQELGPLPKPFNGTGQPNGNGRLNCIAFHPTDSSTMYVGAPAGGFWKTTDAGLTWAKSIVGLTRLGVSAIVVHPTNTDTIFIGTGDRDGGDTPGYGVWWSTDGGATWSPRNNGIGNRTIYEILMDPGNPNRMIAASSASRIYRTTDGGANWVFSTASTSCKDIAFKPGDPNTIYAAGTNTFDVSTNGGVTFNQITSGLPTTAQRHAIAVSPNQPNWVYLLAGGGNGLIGVYRSTDSGNNFSTRTTTPNILGYSSTGADANGQAWYDHVLIADPTNANVIYTAGVNIWKSTNGGSSFNIVAHWTGTGADDVHADHHALEFSPHSNVLYNGNDGGFYFTTDGGTVWTERSDGLGIAQVYKLGVAQTVDNTVINGYQDNGTGIYYDGVWRTEIGGDGMECIIDPVNEQYMYGALYYGDIRRSADGGTTFGGITGPITENGGWVTPYKLDPSNANRMLAGFDNIWRNNAVRTGTAWTRISNFGGTSNIRDLAIAPSNSDVVYVSRYDNTFRRSNNATAGGPTWTNLTGNLPVANEPADIEIDPLDPTHLFIALNNNIYESTNSGGSWTDISGTLPNIWLSSIVIDHDSPVDAMYVGMDVGVYYRDNTMADWVLYSTNLPNVEITELEIHYNMNECKSMLFASTYGQGLWSTDLKDPGNLAPQACFRVASTQVCAGTTVDLTDFSDFGPNSWAWVITPNTFTYVGGTDSSSQNPQVQFTAGGNYTIELTATNGIGFDTETKAAFINVGTATVATAFNDDFETYALCGIGTDCGATTCTLGGQWTNLTNGTDDDIDWRVDDGGTASANTGPTTDFNPGTVAGNYAYLEASGGCVGQTAILETDCIDLDTNYEFHLGYHMYGADMGELHVDILAGGTWTEDIMPVISGDQGTAWQVAVINLAPWKGQTVKLRIRGITGASYMSDLAIDDIRFQIGPVLSADLLEFAARVEDNERVKLEWLTAASADIHSFTVERSKDMKEWEVVGDVKRSGSNYKYWDEQPLSGASYYRLKLANTDGSSSYSMIRRVEIEERSAQQVYPNPANGHITVEGENISKYKIRMLSTLGRYVIVSPAMVSADRVDISTQHLPNGMYFLQIVDGSSIVRSEKVVIEH